MEREGACHRERRRESRDPHGGSESGGDARADRALVPAAFAPGDRASLGDEIVERNRSRTGDAGGAVARRREERNERKTREGIPRGLAGISRLWRRGENAALATIGGTGETEVPNEVAVISQRLVRGRQ